MAEAPQHRFFCHCCKCETNPKLPDLVCPRCDSGFIEEVTEDSSLLQDSTSTATEDSNSLFSELWQLLFMERSALLSHPPSSESHPDDSEQVSAGQSRPSLVSPAASTAAAEAEEPETPSQPEQERSSRPEQRPAVEGCVDMDLAALLGRPLRQQHKPQCCTSCIIQHATVALKPRRLCVGSGRSGRCHHGVVRTAGEHRSTSCRKGDDLVPANSLRLSGADSMTPARCAAKAWMAWTTASHPRQSPRKTAPSGQSNKRGRRSEKTGYLYLLCCFQRDTLPTSNLSLRHQLQNDFKKLPLQLSLDSCLSAKDFYIFHTNIF
nr:PREDICTED: uncharacterized protein LOC109639147 isoform X1 [Paralichthys olivaceus]